MKAGINNSKEVIRNRMLRHALNYWNIKNTEDLDPMVKLILEALSAELYNLGNDIKETEIRLLEKIANLLAPEFLTCPQPAHSIVQALPVEPVELLEKNTHFYTQKKVASRQDDVLDTTLDIFFTPVMPVKLFDAKVVYIATGHHLLMEDENGGRQLVASSGRNTQLEANTLWLGMKLDEGLKDISGLSFYFDWKNIESKSASPVYQLLPLGKWYLGKREIPVMPGRSYEIEQGPGHTAEPLFSDNDLLALMEKDICDFYENRFVNIAPGAGDLSGAANEAYPELFESVFPVTDLQKMTEALLWLKVQFPAGLQQEYLDEAYVYANAFPVMNRQLNDLKYRLKGGSNIIPLKTGGWDQFIAVHSFSDHSHQYRASASRRLEEEATGTYTLRAGGVERFDSRNAKELISYLLELLRSESAAFSAYGHDFIASTLREMNQRIALMEQKTRLVAGGVNEVPHYIMVKPFEGHDLMYVEYWTTLAEAANHLKPGMRLQQYNGSKVKGDSLQLLSSSIGGRSRLRPEDKLIAFRFGLLTRNRIVTKEDIRNFCFYELGKRVSNISIDKGFAMSNHPQQGFFRTIDIRITPSKGNGIDGEAWKVLLDQLLVKLKSRSGMSNQYRLLLQDSTI